MGIAWQRARLAALCIDAGLGESEQMFLQNVIRLVDTSGVLADNALALRTASLTVPWAGSLNSAYAENRRPRQPRWEYVQKAFSSALTACDRLQPATLVLPTALHWKNEISPLLSNPRAAAASPLAVSTAEVEAHQLQICSLVLTRGASAPVLMPIVGLLAAEVALGLISHSCDIAQLLYQAERLDLKGPNFRDELARLIAGQPKEFRVLVPVGGARTFESIEALNPSARIQQVKLGRRNPFAGMGWGPASSKAIEFVETYERSLNHREVSSQFRRQRVVLSVAVRACDMHAAAVVAQRTVAEALDQYVAGHPFVHFELDDTMGVALYGKSTIRHVSLRSPVEKSVRPLAIPWPDALRESMRVSHLLRDATAPMTRVALAWVVIESSGLHPSSIDDIAKMLALETLRQNAFMPYRFLVQDAMDREAVRHYARRAEGRRASARRKQRQAQGPGVPAAAAVRLVWSSRLAELLAGMYSLLAEKAEQSSTARRDALARLDAQVNPAVVMEIGHRAYLPSLGRWLDVLKDGWETSSTAESKALRFLLNEIGISAKASVERLTDLARSGKSAENVLSEVRAWLVDVLNSFYAARNMNLHRGIFTSEVDITLGELAVLVSDSLFEIFGTWYANGTGNGLSVAQISQDVAARYNWVTDFLDKGGSMTEIDIDRLTAPGWSP